MRGNRRGTLHRWVLPFWIVLCLGLVCGESTPPSVPEARLPVEWLRVGPHKVSAEIAVSFEDRRRGLMFRESLPADHGMLFVFPEEQVLSFWMRNTTLPLSIAFADAEGVIVRIADLDPLDERGVTSMGPARYALEMNRGWFRKHDIGVGDRIQGEALSR